MDAGISDLHGPGSIEKEDDGKPENVESGEASDEFDFIEALSIPLEERDKFEKQKTKKALVNEFIKELRLPCYDVVKYYYYYDVIEGLCRSLFQDRIHEKRDVMIAEKEKHDHGNKDKSKDDESQISIPNEQVDEFDEGHKDVA